MAAAIGAALSAAARLGTGNGKAVSGLFAVIKIVATV